MKIDNYIVSPASGKIMKVEGRTLSIFMHIYNIHITVAPLDGVIKRIKFEKGGFKPAFFKSSIHNEKNTIDLGTKYGDIKIVQIAGMVARKVKCEMAEGKTIGRGQRIGKIYFGSRVDVTIPECFEILVKTGDRVKYGKTRIGKLCCDS